MTPQIKRLQKKLVRRTAILSDEDVAVVVKLMCAGLGDYFATTAEAKA